MEETRSEYVEDDNREMRIKHWEARLNDSLHAVYVAQHMLEGLYQERYKDVQRELGHTGMQLAINAGRELAPLPEVPLTDTPTPNAA